MTHTHSSGEPPVVDVVCVGAGFAGLYAAYRMTKAGFTFSGFDAAGGVGGTWYWNRYPGARCDIESLFYSYSFSEELQQEWEWSERYASQPEILRYLEHVADRFDLRRHFTFDTRVTGATWDDSQDLWHIDLCTGERIRARFLVSAAGCLSTVKVPDLPGIENFSGRIVTTGKWEIELEDLRGKRVGVIGTGSSGVQAVPLVAEVAESLVVFQRTPNYVMPARNRPLDPSHVADVRAHYAEIREQARWSQLGIPEVPPTLSAFDVSDDVRTAMYEEAYQFSGLTSVGSVFKDLLRDADANETAAQFVRSKIPDVVEDPATVQKLTPVFHPFGAKRTCFGTDYYETFNRPNVELVSLRETPVQEVTETGVRTTEEKYDLDTLILAIGFDAVTGPILAMNIQASKGVQLQDEWQDGPRTYLGIFVAKFPNLLMIAGPQSPAIMSNVVVSVEQHVDWLTDLLVHMRAEGHHRVETDEQAQITWGRIVDDAVGETLYATTDSWYRGSNVAGKPNAFLAYVGGVGTYRGICEEVRASGYEGLVFDQQETQPDQRDNSTHLDQEPAKEENK